MTEIWEDDGTWDGPLTEKKPTMDLGLIMFLVRAWESLENRIDRLIGDRECHTTWFPGTWEPDHYHEPSLKHDIADLVLSCPVIVLPTWLAFMGGATIYYAINRCFRFGAK